MLLSITKKIDLDRKKWSFSPGTYKSLSLKVFRRSNHGFLPRYLFLSFRKKSLSLSSGKKLISLLRKKVYLSSQENLSEIINVITK